MERNSPVDPETRLKRLRMRAWRRGMKEMDLILGGFVDAHMRTMEPEGIDALETLMDRQDQQLFAWISGATPAPEDATPPERALVATILAHQQGR